ncbi:AAA family ATPase [Altererythrobacter confluentis]|uniref:AAA family ATPase n=1 Tax=Allopontixanthobacter confluentis TaxID=1849021 RepID=A0A6L7GGF3_9SPHN|nr:AAA family ATPase [Allopontixanthobacter confluentis]
MKSGHLTNRIPCHIGQRISIVGASGSGKTFLARRLSDVLSLPHHELDALRSATDIRAEDDSLFASRVTQLVADGAWIIDGHYRIIRGQIWHRADTVILLEYPLHHIAASLGRRYLAARRARAASAPQQNIQPSPAAAAASWRQRLQRLSKTIRERREYRKILQQPEFEHVAVIKLKSREEAENFLRSLPAVSGHAAGPAIGVPPPRVSSSNGLLIEFVGFPGSGKSTVANGLMKHGLFATRKQLAKAWTDLPTHQKLLVTLGLAAKPALVWSALRFLAANKSLKSDVLNRMARILVMSQWQLQNRQAIMLDQGMLQHLMSIHFASGQKSSASANMAPLIRQLFKGRDTHIIVLEISPRYAAQRIAGREAGFSRFDGLDAPHIAHLLQQSIELPREIANAARSAGLNVVEVDASLPVSDIIAALKGKLLPAIA